MLTDWNDGIIAQCRRISCSSEENPVLLPLARYLREKCIASHHSKNRFVLIQLNCTLGMFTLLFSSWKEDTCNIPRIACISFSEESIYFPSLLWKIQ